MSTSSRTGAPEQRAAAATALARWLLELASTEGVPLTQTNTVARAVVREIAERWPDWWNAELFGPPHREMDMPLLEELRQGLRRRRLVRRRGRKLIVRPEAGSSRRTRSRCSTSRVGSRRR